MQKATGTPKHVANCDVCCMFLHFKPYKDGHLHPRSTYVLDVETSESRLTSKMEEPKLADGPRIRMHGAYWQQTSWEAAALPKNITKCSEGLEARYPYLGLEDSLGAQSAGPRKQFGQGPTFPR